MHYKCPNGTVHYLEDDSFSHLLPEGSVCITDEDARMAVEEISQAAFDAMSYAEKRLVSYPPIGEQLDALWKGGDAAADMLARIQAVKLEYPKP